ncbi:MAG TPA: sigma-70 family RNA polymerase sigma factor [Actinomycetota bacterium]|nr:sigma-70 family RNA polymerase sigma factor [Actinomycetota bacterium]
MHERSRPTLHIEQVYREESPRLWRALLAFSANAEVASDAAAEAFAQLLRRGDSVKDPSAWVWKVAFRLAAGELKRMRTQKLVEVPEAANAEEMDWELIGALKQLPAKQRASVVLHHYAGYGVREVARLIGSTPPAVRVHLSNGRKRLRHILGGSNGS